MPQHGCQLLFRQNTHIICHIEAILFSKERQQYTYGHIQKMDISNMKISIHLTHQTVHQRSHNPRSENNQNRTGFLFPKQYKADTENHRLHYPEVG